MLARVPFDLRKRTAFKGRFSLYQRLGNKGAFFVIIPLAYSVSSKKVDALDHFDSLGTQKVDGPILVHDLVDGSLSRT